jgi:hypothetical protein
MEKGDNIMRPIRVFGTAVLLLLLGTIPRIYPQQQQEQQDKSKEQHAQQQEQKKQEHAQEQNKNKQQQQQVQQQQDKNRQKEQQDQNREQQAQQQDRNKQQQQHAQEQDKNKQKQQQVQQQQQVKQQQQQVQQQQRQQTANRPSQQQEGEQRVVWEQHRARNWQSEHRTWQQRGGYNGYRIPQDHYRGYFGRDHRFRIQSLPVLVIGGYPRFQYGGYWFSLVDPWPEYWSNNWYENDEMYIDYFDDGYYLYNRRYPGNRIAITVYLN